MFFLPTKDTEITKWLMVLTRDFFVIFVSFVSFVGDPSLLIV